MKIIYRYSDNFSSKDQIFLSSKGISVEKGFDVFEIENTSADFQEVKNYFEDWEKNTSCRAIFSEEERSKASHLYVFANFYLGYAQPDTQKEVDDFPYPFDVYPYYKGVFEIVNTDENYGVLKGRQIGNYKLKNEPKWGKNTIGSIHYAEDSLFVPLQIYKDVFAPLGILSKSVLNYTTQKPLSDVVQLLPQGISKSPLQLSEKYIRLTEHIEKWGITKFVLRDDMTYPVFLENNNTEDFFYTQEYFGGGSFTKRGMIISQKLYQVLKKNKIKGLNYIPFNVKEEKEIAKKHQEEKRKNARPGTTWSLLDD
ncbi:hypothetical protein ACI76W_03920 [Capnocytophaga canimorsus]|uniref:hypothetical protein n=1 Tax=Capnocytophaga canimorsus TaxID=28188 RepID=UPI00385EC3A6